MTWALRRVFFRNKGEEREIEDVRADQLNIFCRFMMEMKKDGGAYEPTTLCSFQRSLQLYLNDKNSKDQEFQK